MADDAVFQSATPATPPAGTRVSAEEVTTLNGGAVTAQLVQRIIHALRTADGTAVDVTTANPLPVSDAGGTLSIDDGGGSITVDGSLTAASPPVVSQAQNSAGLTTATTAYSSGDVYGSGWTFTSMADPSGGGGRILGVSLLDKADVIGTTELVFASGSITFGTDNAAPSVSDSDAEKILHSEIIVPIDLGGAKFGSITTIDLPYICDATSLYVYAIARSAHTFFGAVTDLRLRLLYTVD